MLDGLGFVEYYDVSGTLYTEILVSLKKVSNGDFIEYYVNDKMVTQKTYEHIRTNICVKLYSTHIIHKEI